MPAIVGRSSAAIYYVDADSTAAADSNDGSQTGPWKTVNKAASAVRSGDIVIVKPGQYHENTTITQSGTSDQLITFRSEPPRKARVQGFVLRGDYIRIEGFEITNEGYGAKGIDAGDVYNKTARKGCRMINNFIHDIDGTAITSGENALVKGNLMKNVHRGVFANGGTLVEDNEVNTLTAPLIEKDGVKRLKKTQYAFFAGDDITFRSNYFHGSPMEQMQTWGVDFFVTWDVGDIGPSHRILIEGNRCFNATHASECEAKLFKQSSHITYRNNLFVNTVYVGILPKEWTNITIENNTLINCGAYPVWLQTPREAEHAVVRNNLIAYWKHDERVHSGPPAESGIRIHFPGPTTQVGYNLLFGTNNRGYGESNFTAEPQFADPEKGDFRLNPGSPGVDAGMTIEAVKSDLRGVTRPQGKAYDIGAYEHDPTQEKPQ